MIRKSIGRKLKKLAWMYTETSSSKILIIIAFWFLRKNLEIYLRNVTEIPILYICALSQNNQINWWKYRMERLDSFSSCRPPGGWQYRPTFRHQYFKNGESKQNFDQYVCERLFSGLSNDTQIDRFCTFGSVILDV